MNHRTPLLLLAALVALFLNAPSTIRAADERLVIIGTKDALGFLKPVPVNISGFTGEADAVLKNDLVFMGVQHEQKIVLQDRIRFAGEAADVYRHGLEEAQGILGDDDDQMFVGSLNRRGRYEEQCCQDGKEQE